jgi:hypothetical protein
MEEVQVDLKRGDGLENVGVMWRRRGLMSWAGELDGMAMAMVDVANLHKLG